MDKYTISNNLSYKKHTIYDCMDIFRNCYDKKLTEFGRLWLEEIKENCNEK